MYFAVDSVTAERNNACPSKTASCHAIEGKVIICSESISKIFFLLIESGKDYTCILLV